MKRRLHFNGTLDIKAYAAQVNQVDPLHVHTPLPDELDYSGYLEVGDSDRDVTGWLAIGDYVFMTWEAGGICDYNRYGSYNGGRTATPSIDNVMPATLPTRLFHHAVGHTFAPTSIKDVSEAQLVFPIACDDESPARLGRWVNPKYEKPDS